MKLTDTNIEALIRLRDGPVAGRWPLRGGMGGALLRMMCRLADAGLVTQPPFEITEEGREKLKRLGK